MKSATPKVGLLQPEFFWLASKYYRPAWAHA